MFLVYYPHECSCFSHISMTFRVKLSHLHPPNRARPTASAVRAFMAVRRQASSGPEEFSIMNGYIQLCNRWL